jgi:hypothetical protein
MGTKLIIRNLLVLASVAWSATGMAQSTPDAKAGSVIVETQPRKARTPAAAPKETPQPIIYVGGNGKPGTAHPKQSTSVGSKATTPVTPGPPAKSATTP